MSFPTIACYPSEKPPFGGQNYDDLGADFFDQFLTYSPVDNEGHDFPTLPQSTFLESSSSDHHSVNTSSSSLASDVRNGLDQDHCQIESWSLPQELSSLPESSRDIQFYSEFTGRGAISDSELLSLEGISLDSPHINAYSHPSLPCSPSPTAAAIPKKKRFVECVSKKVKEAASSLEKNLRSPIRKSPSSPKITRNQDCSELWGQKLDVLKFSFDFEETSLPLSPPPSAKLIPTFENGVEPERKPQNGRFEINNYDTPLSTPILDSKDSRRISSRPTPSDVVQFPPTPKIEPGSNGWSPISGSSKFHPSMYPESDVPLWWNRDSVAPMAQPSPTALHINSQRATKNLAHQLQNDLSYQANERVYMPPNMGNGLMIQMPSGIPAQRSFVVQSSPRQHQDYFPPRQPQLSSRSRHEQVSPRQQQQSRPTRKIRSPSSDSDSPSPKSSPTYHVRKRRTTKNRNSTPRTPTLGGAIDFVNFTPNDSRKILTGVAPSGSSKTKARREKEAMEKRRKLSQAAVRAVREAGGDVDRLAEQGLLV